MWRYFRSLRGKKPAPEPRGRLSVSKKSRDFFDTLSDILTCVKMFSTARESGGSLV